MEFNFNIESERDYLDFVKYLNDCSKNESVNDLEMHKKILNSPRDIISISMSEIRRISKKISKTNLFSFLKFAKDDTYEEVLIQGLVITEIKDIKVQMNYLDRWKDKIDNWSLCDSIVSSMKIFLKSNIKQEYFEYFYNLCFSKKEYVARFGIVTLMTYYLESEYIDKIYEMCISVKNEKYYVKMAIAWLISFGFIKFKEKTYLLLEEKKLDKFTQNKSISKCRDSFRVDAFDKEKLKAYRIK